MVLWLGQKGYHRTNRFLLRWKLWLIITMPIILTPIGIIPYWSMPARCAYALSVIMFFWMFNLIPLPVTALLPLTFIPLLGIASSMFISVSYMKEINMLLLGSCIAAVAVEYSRLHRRIALNILVTLGTGPRWLLLGFILPAVFLSMWINNTSTTALMIPIADSLLSEMFPFDTPENLESDAPIVTPDDPDLVSRARKLRQAIMLGIAHGSGIGGMATLTGTGPNLVLMAAVDADFTQEESKLNYLSWMMFGVPNAILCTLCAWFVLQMFFLGFKKTFTWQQGTDEDIKMKVVLREHYLSLGPMTYHETTVLTVFLILVLLWVTRAPGFVPGWSDALGLRPNIKDSAAAVLAIAVLCALPATADWWWSDTADRNLDPAPPRCLVWKVIHARTTWSIMLLMGGGFACADACKVSGLSAEIGYWMMGMHGTAPFIVVVVVSVVAITLTSFTSNTATATILYPILIAIADGMKISPMLLLIPAAANCSFAFLLPISTPPNAMVFDRANITMGNMAVVGLVQSLVCLIITIISLHVFAAHFFNLSEHPHYKN